MIRPLGKNVLITPIAEDRTTASGLHIVSSKKNDVSRARIESVARGVQGVEAGDLVLYESHAPTVEAGEGRLILSVDYIAAVLA